MRELRIVFVVGTIACLWACGCLAQDCGPNVNSPYGANFHAPGGADLPVLADEAKNCGIGWIRVDFNWFSIETSQNNFSWTVYDAIVAAANSRNLIIFATIGYSPPWATLGAPGTGVPKDPADWYDTLRKIILPITISCDSPAG